MKYKEWLNDWLKLYVEPKVKERTHEKYKYQVERYIIPYLGGSDLEELDGERLQAYIVLLLKNGMASNTVNTVISILKSSLKTAVTFDKTKREYTDCISRPPVVEKQVECFSRQEQKLIESYALSKHNMKHYGILVALYTGVRIGELLALTWKDVDLENATIMISKSCYDRWTNHHYVKKVDTPKTKTSVRLIPIPTSILPVILEMRTRAVGEYVIGDSPQGVSIRSYQKTFELVLNHLRLNHKGFHSLRHTFATRALECGVDVKTLSEILGHKNPSITLTRYAHSLLEHKMAMMNRVGSLFG